MAKEKFYITTAIPYVNASPHIGFALELIQTDAIARYRRQRGDDVFFLTGADENSLKNVQAAEKAGLTTRELVDQNTGKFIDLIKNLNISSDDFIRTVEAKHFEGVSKLWSACRPEDIYKKKYKGLYCVGCEQFYGEGDLIDGKCPEHLVEPEVVEEENYFFKLSNYQKKLEELIETETYRVIPASRKNEVLSFIRSGLEDFSISRSVERAKNWGVPVPGDDSQVMYVWFDALSNYITGLDYNSNGERYQKYWPADVHVVGKGIIRFHAVYWPAMLLSAGVPLPKALFVHDYITINGAKISKSLGNIIDPSDLIDQYGVEAVRYYFLRYIHPFQDSNFTQDHFEQVYTADLSNGLGNLVSRVAGLVEQNDIVVSVNDVIINQAVKDEVYQLLDQFSFNQALQIIWDMIAKTDSLIAEREPWALAKAGKVDELQSTMTEAVYNILNIAFLLEPFLPTTADKINQIFKAEKISKTEPLFPRLTAGK